MTDWSWRSGLTYGSLGLPLAFAALPLYVVLPHFYAVNFGLSLGLLGAVLMAARLMDAFTDPLLGLFNDWLYGRALRVVLLVGGVAALALAAGMTALFNPLSDGRGHPAGWLIAGLIVTSLAYSQLLLIHQAWGVRLGGDEVLRSRIVAWREGPGLLGVIVASVLSVVSGAVAMVSAFVALLFFGWLALWFAPRPVLVRDAVSVKVPAAALWRPLRSAAFRRLLIVFMLNGTAAAVPAALMLFFAQDRLRATPPQVALFLVLYFVCGALSMPGWVALVRRLGLCRSWLAGMLMAIACFAWTAKLVSGQVFEFAVICALTGIALGADLALPGALLARLIEREGAQGSRDGSYLGWWNLATKLNLALAAGAALPLLQWAGYTPGSRDAQALQELTRAYAVLPCALKLLAAMTLYALLIRGNSSARLMEGWES